MSTIRTEPVARTAQTTTENGKSQGAASTIEPADSMPLSTPEEPAAEETLQTTHDPDPRTLALGILSALALLFALQWSQKFLIPLVFGVFISYTLNPLVIWLEKLRIPRLLGTSLVMASLVLGAGAAANTLQKEFSSILEQLPVAVHKISNAMAKLNDGKLSSVQHVQQAATELEKATTGQQAAGK